MDLRLAQYTHARGDGLARRGFAFHLAIAAAAFGGCKSRGDSGVGSGEGSHSSTAVTSTAHVQVIEAPETSDVPAAVRHALSDGAGQGRTVVVYVGATWCEPCQKFHRAAEAGELDSVFPRLTLLAFDSDRDRDALRGAGYTSKYIPLFVLPLPDGTSSGRQVEGGIKGDGAVELLSRKLATLLQQ